MPVIGSSRLSYTLDASNVHGKEYYAPSQSKPKITPETNHDEAAKFIQETVSNKVKLYFEKCEYSAKVVDKNTCSTSFQVRCKYRGESTTLDLRVDFFSFELLQLRDAVKYVNAIVDKEYEVKNTHIYALSDVHPVDLKSGPSGVHPLPDDKSQLSDIHPVFAYSGNKFTLSDDIAINKLVTKTIIKKGEGNKNKMLKRRIAEYDHPTCCDTPQVNSPPKLKKKSGDECYIITDSEEDNRVWIVHPGSTNLVIDRSKGDIEWEMTRESIIAKLHHTHSYEDSYEGQLFIGKDLENALSDSRPQPQMESLQKGSLPNLHYIHKNGEEHTYVADWIQEGILSMRYGETALIQRSRHTEIGQSKDEEEHAIESVKVRLIGSANTVCEVCSSNPCAVHWSRLSKFDKDQKKITDTLLCFCCKKRFEYKALYSCLRCIGGCCAGFALIFYEPLYE